jgi:hypothetical protein
MEHQGLHVLSQHQGFQDTERQKFKPPGQYKFQLPDQVLRLSQMARSSENQDLEMTNGP